ncbi:MAG TPA: hypothetical protein VFA18_06260 [Gemmataceae bacterium]|nr:hypothetical protein [Gemmataceae bacterium]
MSQAVPLTPSGVATALIAKIWLSSMVLFAIVCPAHAGPVVNFPGYTMQRLVTGAGSVDGLAISPSGDLYFTDYGGGRVLKVTDPASGTDKAFSIVASGIFAATDLAFNNTGQLFVTSSTGGASPLLQVFSNGSTSVFASGFSFPTSVAAHGTNLFVTDSGDGTIRRVDSSGGVHDFLSGYGNGNGPYGASFDSLGDLFFTHHGTGQVYEADPSGGVQLLGTLSPLGATFTGVGPGDHLFVSDVLAGTVYTRDASGTLVPFVSGLVGKANPPAIGPTGIVFDGQGNMYIGDGPNIWRVSGPTFFEAREPSAMMLAIVGCGGLLGCRLISHRGMLHLGGH